MKEKPDDKPEDEVVQALASLAIAKKDESSDEENNDLNAGGDDDDSQDSDHDEVSLYHPSSLTSFLINHILSLKDLELQLCHQVD